MKPRMCLTSNTLIREMEKQYPFVVALHSNILQAVSRRDVVTKKRLLFQCLRRFESYMSAEVSKLRNKPNKATKFAIYTKRTITMLKLALDMLPGADQVEAYPTLALTITHYLNIVLPSSLRERDPPKVTACSIYSCIKYLFHLDMEYALDVLICSNVPEDATNGNTSIGFHFLLEALKDQYLYITGVPTLTKYLTIAAYLKEITNGTDPEFKKAIQNLDEKSLKENTLHPDPTDIEQYLDDKYKYRILKLGKNYGFMDLVSKLQPLNIASITRQKRLVVVSGIRRRSGSESENQENESVSSLPSGEGSNPNPDSLFYFDVKGLYTEPGDDAITSPFRSMGIEGSDYEDDEQSNEPNETASVASTKRQVAEGQHENQSDSELEVLFEQGPKPRKTAIDTAVNGDDDDDDDDSDLGDERDYAEPESSEDGVPEYTSDDYGHGRNRSDTENTEGDEDNCGMDDDVKENDFDFVDMDSQLQESYSTMPRSSPVKMEAKVMEMDEENLEDDEGSVKTIRTGQGKGTAGKVVIEEDNQSQKSYSVVSPSRSSRSSPIEIKIKAKRKAEEYSKDVGDNKGSVKTIRLRQKKGMETVGSPRATYSLRKPQPQPATYSLRSRK